ncbi:cardiolipin synthase ClsB [Nitrosomonas sp.]|uniref:cardiolipin synthase ClsB n=1 Tax=Nitrosomonas sp. TaxID=42353 RepID=UPI001DBC5FD5|nr:cardiolipin synthase ClsB [Nitrosomonas sp.]MCB1948780.1 cardiolipin synthase ClsB [Nitrosomonas sp.]MCP5243583.1 cardiolipin synthase ClsB [Burkholderiales bacterium]MDR4515378.1 cardiolipin synthase ClsB [Nitrosomonas sp.]
MSKATYVNGNTIQLLHNGSEFFPALEQSIDSALYEIYLETYIFANDFTGRKISSALIRAARRGVTVHLLIDGFGSYKLPGSFVQNMLDAGVKVLIYRREVFFFKLRRYRLRRMHRKLAVIDARIAFTGGINIIDDYTPPFEHAPRFDYAVSIEGPLLKDIYTATQRLWRIVAWAHFKKRWVNTVKLSPVDRRRGDQLAGFLIRDNFRHRHDIEKEYLSAIDAAQNEIIIANAYFLPGRHFCEALNKAARRGVNVILFLQGKVEYRLQHYATHALYGNLLDAGIKIYEYTQGYLHAKVAVIDQYWATVGSSNIDPFSLMLAREANMVIRNREFASQLRTSLTLAIAKHSLLVARANWQSKSWIYHAVNWFSYYVIYYAQSILGYGQKPIEHHITV